MTFPIDETHDPARSSWVESARHHPDFPIQNLPLGIFSPPGGAARPGVAIGAMILDLKALAKTGLLDATLARPVKDSTLNALLALPGVSRLALRRRLSSLLSNEGERARVEKLLHHAVECQLGLPAAIGDYTDFYVGIHHATNVGRLFRPDTPLMPNYKHVPIGYHGRASSIRVSGEPLMRPNGQRTVPGTPEPAFGPSLRLDIELELGLWVAGENMLGQPVPIGEAASRIGGICLLNDWSTRDIQTWEYQPLGPFLAKSFHSTISPWIITAEALAPFWREQLARPHGDPRPLPYLWSEKDQQRGALDVAMEVRFTSQKMRETGIPPLLLSRSHATNMYWTMAQMVAHHTSNGCNLKPGDFLGTGTISGPTRDSLGSLLEISGNGASPIVLPTGETRSFLEDGDEVSLSAQAAREGFVSIGFGECRAMVLPAPAMPMAQ